MRLLQASLIIPLLRVFTIEGCMNLSEVADSGSLHSVCKTNPCISLTFKNRFQKWNPLIGVSPGAALSLFLTRPCQFPGTLDWVSLT